MSLGFNLHLPTGDVEHCFHVFISCLLTLFVKCLLKFGFFISICIQNMMPILLCQIYVFMNIFSHSMTYVFMFLIVSFDDQ